MREIEFMRWLLGTGVSEHTALNYISSCKRIEIDFEINLDDEFSSDAGRQVVANVCSKYSNIMGTVTGNDVIYKSSVNKYFEFCKNDFLTYKNQPTILIGLGGMGSRIVDEAYGAICGSVVAEAFAIDNDINDLQSTLSSIPIRNRIPLSLHKTVFEMLNMTDSAIEWFPKNRLLFNQTLTEGAGQVRAVSRLMFEAALKTEKFKLLLDAALSMAETCSSSSRRMRISIITSLVGGTGSGLFIELALLLRAVISGRFPKLNLKIQGDFVLPGCFEMASPSEKMNLQANTYAALKELNAINESLLCNGKPVRLHYYLEQTSEYVEHLPFDYCFLYDNATSMSEEKQIVAKAVHERLFGESADIVNGVFVQALRNSSIKRSDNMFGYFECLRTDTSEEVIHQIQLFIRQTDDNNGENICFVSGPTSLELSAESKQKIESRISLVENIDLLSNKHKIIKLSCGLNLRKIPEFVYKIGQYYLSYDNLSKLEHLISPHIDVRWKHEINDIGQEKTLYPSVMPTIGIKKDAVPDAKFVFISYSSLEYDIAQKTKVVLENNGIKCWMAPQSIPAGSDYGSEIPKAVSKCSAFLLLLSKASQESNWVPKEVGIAISKGKIVIPFHIDDSVINDSFNFMLTNNQCIAAYSRFSEAYEELVTRLKDLF